MAAGKAKSELVLLEKQRHPQMRAPAICAALAKQGIQVELGYVRVVLRRKRINEALQSARKRRLQKSLGASPNELVCRLLDRDPTMTASELQEELSRRALSVTIHTIKRARHEWRKRKQVSEQAEAK